MKLAFAKVALDLPFLVPGGAGVDVYARLSEDVQDLDKFLCDMYLTKIRDYALRDACWRQSGGRFTEAYMTWVILAGANPGAKVIDALNETRLTYESVDHLAALMPKRKEAIVSTTTEQRLCWRAGISRRYGATAWAAAPLFVQLSEFSGSGQNVT